MNFGVPQRFIRVNVAHARDKRLIQQQWFDVPATRAQSFQKFALGHFQWFGAQLADNLRGIVHEPPASEFTEIVKAQLASVVQQQMHVLMFIAFDARCVKTKLSGHTQMD
ncbi:MAG: hypothetical protein HDKAJFGB_02596 [Anaerolineae bacterium]|nr:hypothetical protein [Anaerolineae bacterium]